jgi:hypothetical protein
MQRIRLKCGKAGSLRRSHITLLEQGDGFTKFVIGGRKWLSHRGIGPWLIG